MDTPAIMDTPAGAALLPLEIQHRAALEERARLYDIYRNLGIIHLVKSLQDTK